MPKMNRYELYKEIMKLDNKVKVCFLPASEIYNEGLRNQTKEIMDDVKCFIPKPLTLENLVRMVKKKWWNIHNESYSSTDVIKGICVLRS
jgi:two-component SAPR family response regulator